jgi:hypothetical protein
MNRRNLYVVFLLFVKPDPLLTKHIDPNTHKTQLFYDGNVERFSNVNFSPTIAPTLDYEFAASETEAIEAYKARKCAEFPESEGWYLGESTAWVLDLQVMLRMSN